MTSKYAEKISKVNNSIINKINSLISNHNTSSSSHSDIRNNYVAKETGKGLFSGSYNDLSDKPTIPTVPTNVSAFTNDSGYLTSHQDISGKANVSDLGDVAFSNDYTDLDNIPSTFSPSTHTHDDRYYTETEIDTALNGKQATLVSGTNIKTINSQSLLGTGDITVGEDVGTFTELQALIDNASSGDIIILDKDYQYDNSSNLTINKSLTIHGNGHILDGNSMVPILVLNGSNITVTINETTFINGRASLSIAGGAISDTSLSGNSILSLNHCMFIKNQSVTTMGGALTIKNGVINHCIFIENTSKKNGGAIYCTNNSPVIKNCIFKDNIAQNSTGNDIYCMRDNLIIYNCDTSSVNLHNATNKPYLTDHQDISGKVNTTDLREVAFSNDYEDLDNLPTIPLAYTHPTTHPSSMITDSNTHSNIGNTANTLENIITNIDTKLGSLANVDLIEVTSSLGTASANTMNKLYLVAEATGATNDNYEIFVTVRTGTSGNYSYSWEKVDTARIDLSNYLTTANAQQTYVAKESGKGLSSNDYTTSEKNKLAGLHTVATSGSYNDLTNKPSIPAQITVDNTVTQNSNNPVKSSGIFSAIETKQDDIAQLNYLTDYNGMFIFEDDSYYFYGINGRIYHDYNLSNELHFFDSNDNDVNFDDISLNGHTHSISDVTDLQSTLNNKQATLVSGTNIKTINNQSLLGNGNIDIQGGGSVDIATSWGSTTSDSKVPSEKLVKDNLDGKAPNVHTHDDSDIEITDTDITSDWGTAYQSDMNTAVYLQIVDILTVLEDTLTTSDIANNLTTTTSGKVLDARQGKALADLIGNAITYINQ